ncbi:TetR/AcrR family transcriptional regulator [Sphingomonas gei]|uniref:TetR/AcrR family transcriptional regulator n=1 Tax=Sphingomonas gei TaxID=1395960 RepID=A0A4S1X0J1_9SPHN|nr:TetR/AcrR family transcriptional regulator [Sphingomonas gei]TGX49183.1 TetR/AcrR family transcriptional regulator [Sphingomonas gei]
MGRHREFDVDEVLDAAVKVFWRKGYEGTTYGDLVDATGVERPALYSAFGNKEALFIKALARYDERYLDYMPEALALPTAREVATRIIRQAVDLNTRFPEHTGCLGINGGLAVSDDAEPVRRKLNEYRLAGQDRLRERFARAKADGDLPDSADPLALAAFVTTVTQGIAVQAKAGLDRETLELVANEALSCSAFRFSPSEKEGSGADARAAARADHKQGNENVSN